MTTLSQVGARWALLGALTLGAIAACGSSDDKKTPTNYHNDDDDGGGTDGNGSGNDAAGAGGIANGSSTDGGTAAGGRETTSGGVANGGSANGGVGAEGPEQGGSDAEAGNAGGGEGGSGAGVPPRPPEGEGTGRITTGPLVFQVTAAQSPAVVGQRVLYAVTIGNMSDVAVEDVSVLLRMPEGLEFYYTQDAIPSSTGCGNGYCSPKEEPSWNVGTLAPRSSFTIYVNPVVLNTVGNGSSVAPLFRITATGVDQVDVTKTTPVQVSPSAELSLTASADPVVAGQEIELSVDVGQIGATPLAAGKLELELPGGLLPRAASDGGTVTDGKVVWDLGGVSVGSTLHRSLTAKVHSQTPSGEVLNPRASFTYTGGLDVDNIAQLPLSVLPEAPPLSLTVVEQNSPLTPTGQLLYQVTVANTGLRAIDDVSLGVSVPPELSYYYTQDATPASTGCGNGTCSSGEQAGWSLASLPAGTSETFTINASAVANAAGDGTLVSTPFWLRAPGVNPINRLKTVPVYSKPAAQLVLGTAVSPVTPGQTFTYDLDVGQVGASALNGSTLTLELPASLKAGAISDGGTSAAGVVTWDLGNVAVAGTLHRTIEVTVDADVVPGAVLRARSRLTYTGGAELDAESELAVAVVAEPLPLSVKVEATPADFATIGASQLYKTTIKNQAARAVDNVVLLLRVPGFSYYYTTDADPDSTGCGNGTCSLGEIASWTIASIKAGATSVVTVNPTVTPTLTGGSLLTFRQRLTATDLGGSIFLQKTLPTKSP
jgi:trimeric autotransporter adhesin